MLVQDILFEQQPPPGMPGEEEQGPPDPGEEIEPIKKYYLNNKLTNLKNTLERNGIFKDELNIILKFQNELSYDLLLILFNNILDELQTETNINNTIGKNDDTE